MLLQRRKLSRTWRQGLRFIMGGRVADTPGEARPARWARGASGSEAAAAAAPPGRRGFALPEVRSQKSENRKAFTRFAKRQRQMSKSVRADLFHRELPVKRHNGVAVERAMRLFLRETTEAILFAEGSRAARNNASLSVLFLLTASTALPW